MRFRFLFVAAIVLAQGSLAHGVEHATTSSKAYSDSVAHRKSLCTPTRSRAVDRKPETFGKTVNSDNDTTKAAGQFENPYLSKILIRGLVKDKNCVPIPNVTVEIWQADEYGLNRYNKFSALFSERYQENYEQYSNFIGMAAANSDNNGYFTFVSVLPNKKAKAAPGAVSKKHLEPSINISVKHRDFNELATKVHMSSGAGVQVQSQASAGAKMPATSKLIGYRNFAAEKIYGMPTYDVEIVMDGANKYKTY